MNSKKLLNLTALTFLVVACQGTQSQSHLQQDFTNSQNRDSSPGSFIPSGQIPGLMQNNEGPLKLRALDTPEQTSMRLAFDRISVPLKKFGANDFCHTRLAVVRMIERDGQIAWTLNLSSDVGFAATTDESAIFATLFDQLNVTTNRSGTTVSKEATIEFGSCGFAIDGWQIRFTAQN